MKDEIIKSLEKAAGYSFNDYELAKRALSHTSYSRHMGMGLLCSNERLEYLGDALLKSYIARHLFSEFPDDNEGVLSRKSAKAVSGRALAKSAQEMGLGLLVMLSPQEEATGGRMRPRTLAGCFEALIAAIFLDGGLNKMEEFLGRNLMPSIREEIASSDRDPKSALQELLQGLGRPAPTYKVARRDGPDHAPVFEVVAYDQEKEIGKGSGSSMKEAEQAAAEDAIKNTDII